MLFPGMKIRGFRPLREALVASLGPLEKRTLEVVWRLEEVTVRDVVAEFEDTFAYTTVMTTLDRLYKKGILDRHKVDRAYFYRARRSAEEFEIDMARDVIDGLIAGASISAEPVMACFVDAVTDKDRELLDDLERLIKEKKAALRR